MKRIVLAILTGATCAATITACSSTTTGRGEAGSSAPTTTAASTTELAATTDAATPTVTATQTLTSASSHPSNPSATHTTHSSTPTPTPTPTITGPAAFENDTWVVNCASKTDTGGTVKITWSSKGSTSVYILAGATAGGLVYADAKSDGGKGPLPASGSTTLPFSCADDYDYYLIEAYNSNDGTHSGQVQQIPYN